MMLEKIVKDCKGLSHITIPTYVAVIACNLRPPATYVGMVVWDSGTYLWHMGRW